ncbi:hypothetical protein ABKE32_000464 [Escherichia albertii]
MPQTLLTKSVKQQIIDTALAKAGIPGRKAALRAARIAWAERVRLAALGGQEAETALITIAKQIADLAAKVPEGLKTGYAVISTHHYIRLNLAGLCVNAYFNGNCQTSEPGAPEHIYRVSPQRFTLLADDPLVTEFNGFDALHTQIRKDEENICLNVSAALNKCRTVKRLLEAWPEVKELLPANAPPAPLPPAIRRETLNEMIGLPSDEEATA